jgi:membrane protein DedA with SNARE-associated domain
MENLTIEHIISFVEIHRYTGYFILFFAMLLEGEIFLIIAGMLANLDAFDIGDVFWISLLGVILGNMLWYYLGFVLKDKSLARQVIAWAENAMTYFLPRFRERPFKSIFFSKFIYGANRATVIMSGVLKVKFELFLRAEFFASVLWVSLYLAVGHFFGYAAVHITRNASRFALLIVVFVVAFILLQKLLTLYYERREHQKLEKDSNAQR